MQHTQSVAGVDGCEPAPRHRPHTQCRLLPLQGITLVKSDTSGVANREAAMLMRAHKFQSLGDACLTDGVDPGVKYTAPVCNSHDYGWRAPSSSNNRPSLEMFGVAEHGRKAVVKKFD